MSKIKRRQQRMSNAKLLIMLVICIALAVVLLLWNPQPAKAATQASVTVVANVVTTVEPSVAEGDTAAVDATTSATETESEGEAETKAPAMPQVSQEMLDATLVKVGDMAPDFKVDMFDGERVKFSDLRGKVVLVTFWATWCPPCREELRYAQSDLIDRFKGKPFVFLPISRGEEYGTVAAFRKRMGYSFPMGLDTDRFVYAKFATNGIPRNFLIDAEGRVAALTIGFDKAEFVELVKTIDKLLANK